MAVPAASDEPGDGGGVRLRILLPVRLSPRQRARPLPCYEVPRHRGQCAAPVPERLITVSDTERNPHCCLSQMTVSFLQERCAVRASN